MSIRLVSLSRHWGQPCPGQPVGSLRTRSPKGAKTAAPPGAEHREGKYSIYPAGKAGSAWILGLRWVPGLGAPVSIRRQPGPHHGDNQDPTMGTTRTPPREQSGSHHGDNQDPTKGITRTPLRGQKGLHRGDNQDPIEGTIRTPLKGTTRTAQRGQSGPH